MGWFSSKNAHDASKQARQRQEQLANQATAKRQRDSETAATSERVTREHDSGSWWFSR